MQPHEMEAWLGPALEEMAPEQVEQFVAADRAWCALPGHDPDDSDDVLSAALQHILGELDLADVCQQYRRAQARAHAWTLGAVLAGMPEAQAVRLSTLARNTIRKMQGKQVGKKPGTQ